MKKSIIQAADDPAPKAADGDRVRVFVRECKVELSIGVFDFEKEKKQPVVISVEMELVSPQHFDDLKEEKLDRVINYAAVYEFILKELPQQGHIPLVEAIADHIIAFCFKDPSVKNVRVQVVKTAIFPEASGAGVEIYRERKAK